MPLDFFGARSGLRLRSLCDHCSSPACAADPSRWVIHAQLVRRSPLGCFSGRRIRPNAARWPGRSQRPTPRRRAAARSAGVSTSQRSPGHAPVSSIAPERRCRADESGPKCGSRVVPNANSAAVPVASAVGDKAAPMVSCGGDGLGQLLCLQRRQITLQHNNIGDIGRPDGYRTLRRRRSRCSAGRGDPRASGRPALRRRAAGRRPPRLRLE